MAGTTKEVKTEKVTIFGRDYRRSVQFDSSLDMFLSKLPKFVCDILGQNTTARGKSMAEMGEDWDRIVKEYGERVATKRKVIVFESEASVEREEGSPGEDRGDGLGRYNAKAFEFKGKLSLRFLVVNETTRNGQKEYRDLNGHYIHDLSRSSWQRQLEVIDWTAEREVFFRGVIDAIEKAKEKLDSIFDKEAHEVAALIDKAQGPLLGFDEGKK